MDKRTCACNGTPRLIFACSGGSDVGEITDRAARKLAADGVGKMYCLAGIGGRVSGIVATTQGADGVLAIDGCPLNCAAETLARAGITQFAHVKLYEHGFQKGNCPATDHSVMQAASIGLGRLSMEDPK